jgi:hypothetical protein
MREALPNSVLLIQVSQFVVSHWLNCSHVPKPLVQIYRSPQRLVVNSGRSFSPEPLSQIPRVFVNASTCSELDRLCQQAQLRHKERAG